MSQKRVEPKPQNQKPNDKAPQEGVFDVGELLNYASKVNRGIESIRREISTLRDIAGKVRPKLDYITAKELDHTIYMLSIISKATLYDLSQLEFRLRKARKQLEQKEEPKAPSSNYVEEKFKIED